MPGTKNLLATLMLTASLLLAGSAGAVQLQNLTINGVAYVEGMKIDPSVTSLKIAGNIVIETNDKLFANGRSAARYPGVGFFAIGAASCVVDAPSVVLRN